MSKCLKCGVCCSRLIIEFDMHDVLREPKLRQYFPEIKGRDEWELTGVLPSPCPFLKDNKCSIYPTRPYVCVTFLAGSSQCVIGRYRELKDGVYMRTG